MLSGTRHSSGTKPHLHALPSSFPSIHIHASLHHFPGQIQQQTCFILFFCLFYFVAIDSFYTGVYDCTKYGHMDTHKYRDDLKVSCPHYEMEEKTWGSLEERPLPEPVLGSERVSFPTAGAEPAGKVPVNKN